MQILFLFDSGGFGEAPGERKCGVCMREREVRREEVSGMKEN